MKNHDTPDEIHKLSSHSKGLPECEMQCEWSRIPIDIEFKLADGRTLVVLSAGTLNTEAGPDFVNAKISIDGKIHRGNIEIHRKTSDFIGHGHCDDPAYSKLILHVVGNHDLRGRRIDSIPAMPTFVFPKRLLVKKKKQNAVQFNSEKGKCCKYFSSGDHEKIIAFFNTAGLERYMEKSDLVLKNMISDGVTAAFLSKLFDCAGFKRNRKPFASLLNRYLEHDPRTRREHFEAILWGESGLLPDPSSNRKMSDASKDKVKRLWDGFWLLRKCAREPLEWHRDSVRPMNSPERRIAMICGFIEKFSEEPLAFFAETLRRNGPDVFVREMLDSLCLTDEFWDKHTSFESEELKRNASLTGYERALTMLVDVIMPSLHAYIKLDNTEYTGLGDVCIEAYCCLPQTQTNRIFSNAIDRWFESPKKCSRIFNRAVLRQGVHHMYSKYCDASSGDCSSCLLFNSLSQM